MICMAEALYHINSYLVENWMCAHAKMVPKHATIITPIKYNIGGQKRTLANQYYMYFIYIYIYMYLYVYI